MLVGYLRSGGVRQQAVRWEAFGVRVGVALRSPQHGIGAQLGRGEESHVVCALARANGGSVFLVGRMSRNEGLLGKNRVGVGFERVARVSRGCAAGGR